MVMNESCVRAPATSSIWNSYRYEIKILEISEILNISDQANNCLIHFYKRLKRVLYVQCYISIMYNKHRNMFLNTFASTEDQLFQGKYNNKVPPKTDRQGPLESLNGSYDKSSRVRLSKPQHNKGHI